MLDSVLGGPKIPPKKSKLGNSGKSGNVISPTEGNFIPAKGLPIPPKA